MLEDSRIWREISGCVFPWRIYLQNLWLKRLPFQSAMQIQRVPKEEGNARTTHASTNTRCFEDVYCSSKFPDNGMEECTITTFSSAHLDLNNHGWKITDESIEICWMNQKPAPELLEELTSCCRKRSKCWNKMCKC